MGENQVDDSLLNVAEGKTEESGKTSAPDNNLDVDESGVKNVNIDDLVAEGAPESVEGNLSESVEVCGGEKDISKIIIHSNVRLDDINEENNESAQKSSHKKKKRLKIFDSDSEGENEAPETAEEKTPPSGDEIEKENHKSQKRLLFFDSDSEDEGEIAKKINQTDEENSKNSFASCENQVQQKLKGLCDSDTASESDDNTEKQVSPKKSKKLPQKSAKQKVKENWKSTQMTAKQAAKDKQEIQAESQRRIRETAVSLPYHRPKNRTITEFLKKRPTLSTAIPAATAKIPASIAIKMSARDLELMSKQLEERKKEVEEFYKSESDSDDDKENEQKGDLNVVKEVNSNDKNSEVCLDETPAKNSATIEEPTKIICNESAIVEEKMDEELEINAETRQNVDETDDQNIINNDDEQKRISEEYTFNLDDLDEENEKRDQERLHLLVEKYTEKPETEPEKPKSRLARLKEKLANSKPKLSGNPDDVIDLDDGVVRKNDVTQLMQRFMKHVQPQQAVKNSEIQISVINSSQGEIHKEILTLAHDEDDTPAVVNEKPGAKLQKLREELQTKILQQRAELWQKKKQQAEESKSDGGVEGDEEGSEEKDGYEDNILDDEEEEELTESEEEEDEVVEEEKPRKTSAFLDEEAEVSDVDEDVEDEENEVEENEAIVEDNETKKPRKRILNTFDEDSNSNEKSADDTACLDTTVSWEDDGPPSHQKELLKTPARIQTQAKSQMGFLSPVVNLTGLQGSSKFLLDSPGETLIKSPLNLEPSPLKNHQWQSQLQKKLFQETTTQPTNTQFEVEMTQPTTQDLKAICSGGFTGVEENPEESEKPTKVDDEDEAFITQILNEDEMEKFKRKFTSPAVVDSEDDEEIVQNKRQKKRLVFSDDEDEEVADEEEEEIGLHDEDDETNDGAIDYDSEENEIVEARAPRMRPKDFLENEAELSESDWDSEDEDEKGLDVLEKEAGDEEKFDEDELRKDLEKIHMRRVLDQDTREVKMLQELLLDDGELHGTGRQRQFRWRNINDDPEEENKNTDEVDVYLDDDETEEEWRRKRHEREMFLKKEMEKSQRFSQDDDLLGAVADSEILKLGHAALRKTQQSTLYENTLAEPFTLPTFTSKRGSFLSRADSVLARIAEMTKVSTDVVVAGAKSTKNVVFHSVQRASFESKSFVQQTGVKRKSAEGTPRRLKKLRMETSVVDN